MNIIYNANCLDETIYFTIKKIKNKFKYDMSKKPCENKWLPSLNMFGTDYYKNCPFESIKFIFSVFFLILISFKI